MNGGAESTRRPTSPDEVRAIEAIERAVARGEGGVATLISMLGTPSWATRRRVVSALAACGASALGPLCAVVRDARGDETANAAAMDALSASVADATPALLELAAHADPAVASDAARVLGRRRARAAVPRLAVLAAGDDDNVAVAAIEALGSVGGRGAVTTLIALVRTGNFFRTFPAIDVLGRSADPRAIGPLVDLLGDARYALEAARALGRTADRGAAAPLAARLAQATPMMARVLAVALDDLARAYRERYGSAELVEQTIASAAPAGSARALSLALAGANEAEQEAIARLFGLLRDPSSASSLDALLAGPPAVARAAVSSYQRLGSVADDRLRELLRDGDSSRRAIVLPLVARRTGATDEIATCVDDPDGTVRALAADALARTGATAAVPALFPLLSDPNARVVQAASAAIQALGSDATEGLALAAAAAPEARVRREAMHLVRAFGWRSALPAVEAALADPDARLREAAIMALPFIDDARAKELLLARCSASSARDRATAMRALGQGEGDAGSVATLLEATRDTDAWVRYYAAQALGRLQVDDAAGALVALLDDPAGQVRVAAVESLARLRATDAFAALERASRSPDGDIARAAVLGLGLTQRPEAVSILLQALRSSDAATRLVATSALGRCSGPQVTGALLSAARDPDEVVRQTAIAILEESPGEDATLALTTLLGDEREAPRVRLALSASSPGRVAGLVRALGSADDETAAVLASSLTRMRTLDAQEALELVLATGPVAARKAAAIALGNEGRPGAVASLERAAATDPDAEVRSVAAAAVRG